MGPARGMTSCPGDMIPGVQSQIGYNVTVVLLAQQNQAAPIFTHGLARTASLPTRLLVDMPIVFSHGAAPYRAVAADHGAPIKCQETLIIIR